MPNYDYVCETCGHQFEVFQSMKDAKLEACPQEGCGGHVRRLLGTGAGIIFKGSGFYQTDYRSNNYKEGAKKEAGESKPAAAPSAPASSPASSSSSGSSGSRGGGSGS